LHPLSYNIKNLGQNGYIRVQDFLYYYRGENIMKNSEDLVGQKFGRWTVLEKAEIKNRE